MNANGKQLQKTWRCPRYDNGYRYNFRSCSRRYFRSYIQYYCKWKICITNYCLTFCYFGGVNENSFTEILNCLLQKDEQIALHSPILSKLTSPLLEHPNRRLSICNGGQESSSLE